MANEIILKNSDKKDSFNLGGGSKKNGNIRTKKINIFLFLRHRSFLFIVIQNSSVKYDAFSRNRFIYFSYKWRRSKMKVLRSKQQLKKVVTHPIF